MAKRILAVDDSATMRQLIRMTLTRAGFDVTEAEDGVKGLQRATAENV
jgi:two-component system chemotaxis response regulator CheY